MLKVGLATVYEAAGAEYGGYREKMVAAEKTARKARIGMWQQTRQEYQSPGDFKKMSRFSPIAVDSDPESVKTLKIDINGSAGSKSAHSVNTPSLSAFKSNKSSFYTKNINM